MLTRSGYKQKKSSLKVVDKDPYLDSERTGSHSDTPEWFYFCAKVAIAYGIIIFLAWMLITQ